MSYVAEIEDTITNDESNNTPVGVLVDQDWAMTILYEETDIPIDVRHPSKTTVVEGTAYKDDDNDWGVSILPTVKTKLSGAERMLLFYSDISSKPLIAGQTITVDIVKEEGSEYFYECYLICDYALLGWQNFLKRCNEGEVVDGYVVAQIKDGLMVKIFTFDAILPFSELDSDAFRKPKDFVGQTIKVQILKIYEDLHKVVVSRKFMTSHTRKEKTEKKEVADDKKIFAEIRELRTKVEKLEAEIAKLKETPQQKLRSTVEKHDDWW